MHDAVIVQIGHGIGQAREPVQRFVLGQALRMSGEHCFQAIAAPCTA